MREKLGCVAKALRVVEWEQPREKFGVVALDLVQGGVEMKI